jgi:hypothetical protein
MFRHLHYILLILVTLIVHSEGQNPIATRLDISYNVAADSLFRKNNPQNLNLSIACGSSEVIDVYRVTMSDTEVLWTVVSAELNGQPLWLIMNNGQSPRNNILAWDYDEEQKMLRFYPPPESNTYNLDLHLQINLLHSGSIQKKSTREVILEAQAAGNLTRCSLKEGGNKVAFQ